MSDQQTAEQTAEPQHPSSDSSLTIGKLVFALAKAQAVIQPALKDKDNPFFKSRYADLSSIWESIRKPLTDNELAVIQTTEVQFHGLFLITTLAHSSGEWFRSTYPINPIKNDPQGIGSAITYARRYALAAIAGASTEDDDGNQASQGSTQGASQGVSYGGVKQYAQDRAAKVGSGGLVDWEHYKYRYHLPVKKEGKDMEAVRTAIKQRGFRFNAEDKHWYGSEPIEKLAEFLRPLGGAQPDPQQSLPTGPTSRAATSPQDDLPAWNMNDLNEADDGMPNI